MPARADAALDALAQEVAAYLSRTPRQLPTRLLYDDLGSALFEAICRLPWYRITRTEQALLDRHAASVLAHTGLLSAIVELGPGSGEKLVTLLRAAARSPLDVHLIDVSSDAIAQATRTITTVSGVTVYPHLATYDAGLRELHVGGDAPALVLFLGSNIGNFDPAGADDLMDAIRQALRPGDFLLLGADLVKPEPDLRLAYDDPLGVTAAFNRNLLVRINRECEADFALDRFSHRAVWNGEASRVEMYLVCTRAQRVRIARADVEIAFEAGETIWTESSYKYSRSVIGPLFERAGFAPAEQWVQDGFALTLGRAV